MESSSNDLELSIVMPCLNEEETMGACVSKALKTIRDNKLNAEVLISDNGSVDQSINIATRLGARVIVTHEKGYGSALMNGFKNAGGRYLIMGDADDSYDFGAIMPFVEQLRKGADLVVGNRFLGGIEKGAMPFLHKYLGNPVLSAIGRLFFSTPVRDFHCGLRGLTKEAFNKLGLQCKGMEFASEMIIKASLGKLNVTEVATTLSVDGRKSREPHLRTWRDGWRHLRLLLIYAPNWLFIYPGLFLIAIGTLIGLILNQGELSLGMLSVSLNTLLYSYSLILTGLTITIFGLIASTFRNSSLRLRKEGLLVRALKQRRFLETGIITGFILVGISAFLFLRLLLLWKAQNFGRLDPTSVMFFSIPSAFFFSMGTQIIFSSFLIKMVQEEQNERQSSL